MNTYYIGLIMKILLLAALVAGVFFGLQAVGYRFVAGPETTATVADPRSILLVLMEAWEKTLVAKRGDLEKQRTAYTEKLQTISDKVERAALEKEIRDLNAQYVQNNTVLASVSGEVKNLEAREKYRSTRLAELADEKLKANDELFTARLYWSDYTDKIKNELLAQVKTEAERGRIVQAFQEDNGLTFITSISREYFAQGKELSDIKSDTSLKDTLDKTAQAKSGLEAMRKDLEKRIKDQQVVITSNEGDLRLMKTQIEILLDVGQFNGFFISRNNRTEIIVNPKRLNDILATGQFIVYNNKKAAVSKIYVSKKNNQIVYTKLPGYDEPKPGTYF
jgi:hypothetical protein